MVFNKIKKLFALGMLGLGLAYNVSCGDVDYPKINQKPVIMTDSLENAIAGEYYQKQIEVYDENNDQLTLELINAPQGMVLENNIIKWSPRHSRIGPDNSQTGNFIVKMALTDGIDTTYQSLELVVFQNNTLLDYLRTDENIRFACEDPCVNPNNVLEDVREDELDEASEGKFNAVNIFKQTTKSDTPDIMKPVDYHILDDSECGRGTYLGYTTDGRYKICNYTEILPGGYIKPVRNITDLKDIRNNGATVHEYTHATFYNYLYYSYVPGEDGGRKIQEAFAVGIERILTDYNGDYPGTDSFCDLGNISCDWNKNVCYTDYMSPDSYKLLTYNLCSYHGFDIKDLPEMFYKLSISTDDTAQNFKCIMDSMEKTNTWQAFIDADILVENSYCGNNIIKY